MEGEKGDMNIHISQGVLASITTPYQL